MGDKKSTFSFFYAKNLIQNETNRQKGRRDCQ